MDLMDRLFWGMAGFIGIHFLWLGWLEAYLHLADGSTLAFAGLVWFNGWAWRLLLGSRAKEPRGGDR